MRRIVVIALIATLAAVSGSYAQPPARGAAAATQLMAIYARPQRLTFRLACVEVRPAATIYHFRLERPDRFTLWTYDPRVVASRHTLTVRFWHRSLRPACG